MGREILLGIEPNDSLEMAGQALLLSHVPSRVMDHEQEVPLKGTG